jgi:hypothetical protein
LTRLGWGNFLNERQNFLRPTRRLYLFGRSGLVADVGSAGSAPSIIQAQDTGQRVRASVPRRTDEFNSVGLMKIGLNGRDDAYHPELFVRSCHANPGGFTIPAPQAMHWLTKRPASQ